MYLDNCLNKFKIENLADTQSGLSELFQTINDSTNVHY